MVYKGSLLYQHVLSPFYDKLVRIFPASVHPNTITLIGGFFALISNIAMLYDYRWSACILFTLYHMFDNMDGKHARATKQTSEFGAILDHFVDGTVGIWSGGLSFYLILGMDEFDIALGVWAFTGLFWSVHMIHALTGFFEIGNDYLSIDEAFVILSLLRAVWALDIPLPFFTYYRSFQYALIAFVSFSAIQWFYLHYNKIPRGGIRDSSLAQNAIILYVIYCVIALFHLFTSPSPSLVVILTVWAVPYAVVLWQTRNKH